MVKHANDDHTVNMHRLQRLNLVANDLQASFLVKFLYSLQSPALKAISDERKYVLNVYICNRVEYTLWEKEKLLNV